jgi:hypothetical protein
MALLNEEVSESAPDESGPVTAILTTMRLPPKGLPRLLMPSNG